MNKVQLIGLDIKFKHERELCIPDARGKFEQNL
jgi:hypothetical protein